MNVYSRHKKIFQLILPLFLLIAGLYLGPIRIYEKDFSKIPGDLGDSRLNNYFLEHGFKYFTGKTDEYWNAPFMYPFSNTMALADNLLGSLPIYIVYRLLGLDKETSYQFWLLTLFALNFIACYWVLNKLSGNNILSATGAYIYSFSLIIISSIYHVQTYPRFIIPFVFYWTWLYFKDKKAKYFLLITTGVVFQFYCGMYLGIFLVYSLLFFFIAYLTIYKSRSFFKKFAETGFRNYHFVSIFLGIMLLVPLFIPYLKISAFTGNYSFEDIKFYIPTIKSYFFTSDAPLIWKFLFHLGENKPVSWWNHFLFIGFIPWFGILLFPVSFFIAKDNSKKKFILLLLTWLFLSFLFTLRIGDFSLYKVFSELPGFSSMRAVFRIINVELFLFVILFVFVFHQIFNNSKVGRIIVFTFPLLVIIDNYINPEFLARYEKKHSQFLTEEVKVNIKNLYNPEYSAIAYLPKASREDSLDPIEFNLNVMLASQDLNITCVNGYSGYHPLNFNTFFFNMKNATLNNWLNDKVPKNKVQIMYDLSNVPLELFEVSFIAANETYLCAEKNMVLANRYEASEWETFSLIIYPDDKCMIIAYNHTYLQIDPENKFLHFNQQFSDSLQYFQLMKLDDIKVAFKAGNGKFLSLQAGGDGIIKATADTPGERETFIIIVKE